MQKVNVGSHDVNEGLQVIFPLAAIQKAIKQLVKDELSKQIYPNPLFTVDQAAELCGVTRNTFYIWLRKGLIDKVDFGDRCIRVRKLDVEAYVESRTRRRKDEIELTIQSVRN